MTNEFPLHNKWRILMKIQILDQSSKKPLMNAKLQFQVRGKDSGYISCTTDASGWWQLDDKYKGQQITPTSSGGQSQWTNANDGIKLYVNYFSSDTKGKQKQTTSSHK